MTELLALLSPGAVMAFLMAAASMSLILQVANQDSKYSPRLKTFLLILAWPIFIVSLLIFMGLLVLALLPVAQQYSVEIPYVSIDPSLFVLWGLTALFLMTFSYIYSFFLRKMAKWLPKSEAEKNLENLSNVITETFKEQNKLVDRTLNTTKNSIDMVKETEEMVKQTENMVKDTMEIMENYKEITKSYKNGYDNFSNVSDKFGEQVEILGVVSEAVVKYVEQTSKEKKEAERNKKKPANHKPRKTSPKIS